MLLRGLFAAAGRCARLVVTPARSASGGAATSSCCPKSATPAARLLRSIHTAAPCAARRSSVRRDLTELGKTVARAAKKAQGVQGGPGAEVGSGDGRVSVEYVYEGDPEPVQDEQPLGEVMYDLTPDDGVEDDDSVDDDDLGDDFEDEDYEPTFTTGGVPWGDRALATAREVLSQPPCVHATPVVDRRKRPPTALRAKLDAGANVQLRMELMFRAIVEFAGLLEMYSFRVHPKDARIVVRIDKPADRFGSPAVDELSEFSVAFDTALCAASIAPEELTVEVSSPGAERQVRVPQDLLRFQGLPMRVVYDTVAAGGEAPRGGKEAVGDELLDLVAFDEAKGLTTWQVANVRANRTHLKKGQPLSKKVKDRRLTLPLAALRTIHLHIDV